jgi:hypothetical protein
MNRTWSMASGIVAALVMLGGCATPGSVSARSGVAPLPSSAAALSASPAPASSASPAPASSTEIVGMGPPPCPAAEFQVTLGPHVTQRPGMSAAVHKPFGDVGVTFGPQQSRATVLWARLDVVVTVAAPIPPGDPTDLSSFSAAEASRPDSSQKLSAGTDPYVARVTLKPFAQGPFVLPAATLNALPTGVASYTVYLIQSVDESVCFGATPNPSAADSDIGSSVVSEIADLVP